MIRKEQLLRIQDLRLSGVISTMTDTQYVGYVQTLNALVDRFPNHAKGLTDALETGQFSLLSRRLSELCDILTKLHANDIAAQCRRQIQSLTNASKADIDEDTLEAFIENLIQSVSALCIEIQMAEHKSAAAASSMSRSARPASHQTTILAVDNAVMFLNTLQKLLSGAPYELHCVTSAADALEFLARNRPDVILLDVEMPDMNGYELAKRIKQSGQKAPIIFITANSSREYVDKAVEAGAVGLLMKPLRINQLLAKIKENI